MTPLNAVPTPVATGRVPVVGQLVAVRGRRFVVTTADTSANRDGRTASLLALASVDDDALGEELSVIWELEPGAAILERASMPELAGFDEPARLDAFLNAVRWGAAYSLRSYWRIRGRVRERFRLIRFTHSGQPWLGGPKSICGR